MQIEYAEGLSIEWTDKELDKIKEIKNRRNRGVKSHRILDISYDKLDEVERAEIKRRRNAAVKALYEYGYFPTDICELFGIPHHVVEDVLYRRNK